MYILAEIRVPVFSVPSWQAIVKEVFVDPSLAYGKTIIAETPEAVNEPPPPLDDLHHIIEYPDHSRHGTTIIRVLYMFAIHFRYYRGKPWMAVLPKSPTGWPSGPSSQILEEKDSQYIRDHMIEEFKLGVLVKVSAKKTRNAVERWHSQEGYLTSWELTIEVHAAPVVTTHRNRNSRLSHPGLK